MASIVWPCFPMKSPRSSPEHVTVTTPSRSLAETVTVAPIAVAMRSTNSRASLAGPLASVRASPRGAFAMTRAGE